MIMLPFGVWVIRAPKIAPRRVRKINYSIKVWTSKVRVLTFGLSSVILDFRNPRKKEKVFKFYISINVLVLQVSFATFC